MLSAKERHERFVTAFNRIDKHLRQVTGMHKSSMARVIESYLKLHPGWKDEKAWRAYTSLRNVIVHERYSPNSCLFIPTDEAVQDIERIDQNLRRPATVGSRFKRDVVRIRGDTALTEVFDLIYANSYSQFPVCDDTECVGLLTENGITRWISENWKEIDRIDFDNVSVQEVLKHEEPRENHQYISKDTPVDDAFHLFKKHQLLEAILITEDGRNNAELLGIITPWDVLKETEASNR